MKDYQPFCIQPAPLCLVITVDQPLPQAINHTLGQNYLTRDIHVSKMLKGFWSLGIAELIRVQG